jgi:hypothetical protein
VHERWAPQRDWYRQWLVIGQLSMGNFVHLIACLKEVGSCSFVIGVLQIVFDCCRELPSIGPQELQTAPIHRVHHANRTAGQQMTATLPEYLTAGPSYRRVTSGSTFASYVVGNDPPHRCAGTHELRCCWQFSARIGDRSLIMADMISRIKIPRGPRSRPHRFRRMAPPLTGKSLIPHPLTERILCSLLVAALPFEKRPRRCAEVEEC